MSRLGERRRRSPELIPMSLIDQLWVGATVIPAVGPIVMPSREAVVQAFVALASRGPDTRIGLRFSPDSPRHWLYRLDDIEQYAESCVIRLPPGADDDLDALMSRLAAEPRERRPVEVFLGDRHMLCRLSHAVGDSRINLALPAALVTYTQDGTIPEWLSVGVDPHPMRSALRHTFADRASISAMLTERREVRAAAPARPTVAPRSASTTPFRPQPVSVSVAGPPEGTKDVRAWTRHNLRGAAHFATVLTTVAQALTEQGIPCAPGVHMMFDLRRYLPRGHRTTGSFVWGLDLPVVLTDPQGFTEVVTRAAKVGRPLAANLAACLLSAKFRMLPERPAPPPGVPENPQAQLALSYITPRSVDDGLPWAVPPDRRMYWCGVDPAGPTAMTLLVGVIGKRLQLAASFHATVFDPAAVRAALQAAHDDSIGLLQRATASAAGPTDGDPDDKGGA